MFIRIILAEIAKGSVWLQLDCAAYEILGRKIDTCKIIFVICVLSASTKRLTYFFVVL